MVRQSATGDKPANAIYSELWNATKGACDLAASIGNRGRLIPVVGTWEPGFPDHPEHKGSPIPCDRVLTQPTVRDSKTSTPYGNGLLTLRPSATRDSESFAPNRARWKGSFRTPKGTAAKQSHRPHGVAHRKPHETLGKTKKRLEGHSRRFQLTGRAAIVR